MDVAIEGIIATSMFLIIMMILLSNVTGIFQTHATHIENLRIQSYADNMANYIGSLLSSKPENAYFLRNIKIVNENYWNFVETTGGTNIFYYITVSFSTEFTMKVDGNSITINSKPSGIWVNVYIIGGSYPDYEVKSFSGFTPLKLDSIESNRVVIIGAGGAAVYGIAKNSLKIIDKMVPSEISDKYLVLYYTEDMSKDPGWGIIVNDNNLENYNLKPPLVVIYEDSYMIYPDLYPKIEIPDPNQLDDPSIVKSWKINSYFSSRIVEVDETYAKIEVFAFYVAKGE